MADRPFMPVRSRMAISSALEILSAPSAARRSRGRSWAGRSWMRTLAFIANLRSQISEGKSSRMAVGSSHDVALELVTQVWRNAGFEKGGVATVVAFDHLRHGMQT